MSPDWIIYSAIFARLQWKSLGNRDVTKHIQSGTTLMVDTTCSTTDNNKSYYLSFNKINTASKEIHSCNDNDFHVLELPLINKIRSLLARDTTINLTRDIITHSRVAAIYPCYNYLITPILIMDYDIGRAPTIVIIHELCA